MINTLISSNRKNVLESLSANIEKSVNTKITTYKFGYESIYYIKKYNPQVIIIDIDLEDINGIELFQTLSDQNIQAYKILFSTKHEQYIELAAYDAGVDYFLTEIVSDEVFQKKIIQVYDGILDKKNRISYNSLIIDTSRFQIISSDKHYELPKKQFLIFALLCEQPGKVFTREEIYEKIWSSRISKNNRTVDVHIREIRKSLPNNNIKTFRGVGYKVEA